MSKLPIGWWHPVDISAVARPWTQDADGVNRRMGTKAEAVKALADAVNNLLAWHQRPTLSAAWPPTGTDDSGLNPFLNFMYLDSVRNGRSYTTSFIALPAIGALSGNVFAGHMNGYTNTAWYNQNVAAQNFTYQAFQCEYSYNRNARSGAEKSDGISTYNKFTVLAVNQQDDFIYRLDTDIHDYVNPALARKGEKVLDDAIGNVRAHFEQLRGENLPVVLQWCAQGITNQPASTFRGITVVSTTLVNIFNQGASGDEVGSFHDAQNAGVGQEWTSGRKVPVMCRVYARQASGTDATVRFYGPANFAGVNNWTDIAITSTLGWHGDDTNIVYLDSAVAGTDVTASGNQVRVYASIQHEGAAYIYIHGVRCWLHWDRAPAP